MTVDHGYWAIADYVKRSLFNKLREMTTKINYLDYHEYKRSFEAIHGLLIEEWNRIQEEFKGNPDFNPKRLKGYLLEVLFYYACLKMQANFIDAEIVEMEGVKFKEYPPWFEATPLYDIIAPLHHIREKGARRRRAPQTRADFFITYVDNQGSAPPSMVEVKTRKLKHWRPEWGWQIPAALRRGFIFQIAYPRNGVEYPKELDEWETATPCSNCKKMSQDFRKCTECGDGIFPFTIADAHYEVMKLRRLLGKDRKGRF